MIMTTRFCFQWTKANGGKQTGCVANVGTQSRLYCLDSRFFHQGSGGANASHICHAQNTPLPGVGRDASGPANRKVDNHKGSWE